MKKNLNKNVIKNLIQIWSKRLKKNRKESKIRKKRKEFKNRKNRTNNIHNHDQQKQYYLEFMIKIYNNSHIYDLINKIIATKYIINRLFQTEEIWSNK